jgi:cytochrome c oxidase assembly factor CtaG
MSIWADANGWPIPPAVLLGCLVAEILYFRGWRRLVRAEQAKAVRAKDHPVVISAGTGEYHWGSWFWRGTYFLGAVIVLLLASSAPVDLLSSKLFWVHMIQHLLMLVVIAPLFVAGAPLLPFWLGLPGWVRRLVRKSSLLKKGSPLHHFGHWLRNPVVTCALLIIGMWAWHWPALYDLALTNGVIHDWCEHLTFLTVSFLYWTQVIPSPPLRLHMGYVGRVVYLGVAIIQNVILAIVLGFAPVSLYAPYAHLITAPGGLSALSDQRLGAGIMWTAGDFPFIGALCILVLLWLASQSDEAEITVQSQTYLSGKH